MLERAGFEVVAEARDGVDAVRLATVHEPDLAVMDVKMPNLDGIDAARQIIERRPIPIVMLTAFSEAALVDRAVEAGVFGYLVKPFRVSDLLPSIEAARARHVYHLFTVRHPRRDALAKLLTDDGISTAVYYPRSVPDQPMFGGGAERRWPEAWRASREVLSLPCFAELTDDEVERVVAGVRRACERL